MFLESLLGSWLLVAVTCILALAALYVMGRGLEPSHDPREPPLVRATIPFVGHVWGLFLQGPKYFQRTSKRAKSSIYTLNVLNKKLYAVTAPNLVNRVSRKSKSISFNPFISEVGIRLTGASDAARTIIERNIDGSQGNDSYVLEIHDRTVAALIPGDEMNRISSKTLRSAWADFLQPIEAGTGQAEIHLYAFLRRLVTTCSSTAVYGTTNPFLDPDIDQAFWDYNCNLNMLLINIFPTVTARRGYVARTQLSHAFQRYFESSPQDWSALAEARCSIGSRHGLGTLDIARLEIGLLIGLLVNTVPIAFYMILHTFESPELVQTLRQEIESQAIGHHNGIEVLNLTHLRENCKLLHSTLQETLRVYSEFASARMVMQDTLLDGRYFLKKGSILQMPNSVIHRDSTTWGDITFQADRFLPDNQASGNDGEKTSDGLSKDPKKRPANSAASYRPWGGGSTLCPGRHFAATEILGLTAVLLWRFDISPAVGEKQPIPEPGQLSAVEGVFPPKRDVRVKICSRKNLSSNWDFESC